MNKKNSEFELLNPDNLLKFPNNPQPNLWNELRLEALIFLQGLIV